MAGTVDNLIMGTGYLYSGAVGATEPADTAVGSVPSSAAWTDVGYTRDGVALVHTPTYTMLEVDQEVDNIAARLTSRTFVVKTNMAEPTLEKLKFSFNNESTISTGAGYKSIQLDSRDEAVQPSYTALIFDGFAPGVDKTRRVIVRRAANLGATELAYKKDEMTILSVEFTAFATTDGTRPVKIVDEV